MDRMIFLHETHEIVGGKTAAFESAFRAEWVPLVEAGGGARLLWYWHLTHGTGASYQAVSLTAVRDWATWGEMAARMRASPDGRRWREASASLRREVVGKLLEPVAWSPLQDVELGVATVPDSADTNLYLHDTGWPYPGKLDAYVEALGSIYFPQTRGSRMIRVDACLTVCPGSGRGQEVVLLQTILDWPAFSRLLTEGERPSRPGDWMEEGLKYRDRWESKLLRPAAWSPRK
jgi:hypothetical protein